MDELTKNQKRISIIFQLIAAAILGMASYQKFIGEEMTTYVFKELGIESTRLIIATIEGAATLLLLSKAPQYGAILGFCTMLGALIAHCSVLGLVIQNDNGKLVMMMGLVIVSTSIVMWIRRRKLPLIGHTFTNK